MEQNHPYHSDIPAYALGALEADEAAALEAHLRTCEICQKELAAFRLVSDHLLLANPPRMPPARVRQGLLEHLPSAHKPFRPRFRLSPAWISLGLAVTILLGLNIYSQVQIRSLSQEQAGLAQKYESGQAVLAMLSSAGTRSIPISAGTVTGTFLLDRDRNAAMLIIWNLPQLAGNQTYQAWLIDPQGRRTSAGIFKPEVEQGYTSLPISAAAALTGFTGMGVTVEPAGGSAQPTGQRVFKVDF